jgi:hypothetical protein
VAPAGIIGGAGKVKTDCAAGASAVKLGTFHPRSTTVGRCRSAEVAPMLPVGMHAPKGWRPSPQRRGRARQMLGRIPRQVPKVGGL